MAQGISDANYKAVYNSLRQQGYSHAEAVREAAGVLSWGAAPEDPVFGTPESRVDGAPSAPITMDAVVGQQDLAMPYPPMSYGQYRTARQRAERGLGPMPQDAFETDADIRARYEGKYGQGSYDADAPGRKSRSGIEPGPVDEEGYGGFAAAMAEAETGMTRAQRIALAEEKAREWDRKKREYDAATGLPTGDSGLPGQDGSGRDWSNWQPGMPLPAEAPDGSVLADNARRAAEEERKARDSAARNKAIGKKYGQKAQEIAEAGDARGVTDYDATRTKAEQDRIDYRRQQEMLARQGNQAARANLREQDARGAEARKEFRSKVAAADSGNFPSEKERWATWRAQAMLSGGRPTGGPNGTKAAVSAFQVLTPAQQQEVVMSRMRYGDRNNQRGDEWDRRLDLMRMENEARFKEAEAARAEARDEREKDRTLTRDEGKATREALELRLAEERKRSEMEWQDRVRQHDAQQLDAKNRHDQQSVALAAQLTQIQNQGAQLQGELALAKEKQDAALGSQQRAQKLAEQTRREQEAAAAYGPGAVQILRGNHDTPAAQQAFKRMAAQADQTWNGFFTEDAERLDAILVDLGITDPNQRRSIVQEYGINSSIPGQHGRGSILSAWRVSHPEYVAPPQ